MPAAEPATIPAGDRCRIAGAGALIALAAVVAYHNSFAAPFFFDDRAQINDNPTIRHLWTLGAVLSPPVKAGVGGRPLLNLSFAVNYALGGMNPWGYHAYNLLIHILAGLALFGIVRRTLSRFRENSLWPAFAIALIWTVHPLQTEAVTYVAERAESQMGLFYLLTLYFFIRSVESEGSTQVSGLRSQVSARSGFRSQVSEKSGFSPQPSAKMFQVFAVTFCLCCAATKEVAVTLPVIVLLYDRTFVSGTFREAWRRHRGVYLGFGAAWLLLAYLLANLRQRGVGLDMGGGSWFAYALVESRAIERYLRLAFWPHPQVFDYGMGVRHPGWSALPDAAVVLALVAASAWALLRRGQALNSVITRRLQNSEPDPITVLGFAGAWFFVILAPTSSVVAVAGQPTAEHRMYLPLAGVVVAVFCAGDLLLGRALRNRRGLALALAAAVALVAATVARNEVYRSELSIWSDTAARQPDNERAQNALGLLLAGAGNPAGAIVRYREALRLNPDYPEAHQNLAAALQAVGLTAESVAQCRELLRLRPDRPESQFELGVALQLDGRTAEAIAAFEQALRMRADYPDAENNLGLALAGSGRTAEAITHFGKAVQLRPDSADLRLNLGSALYNGGNAAAAVEQMAEAVRLDPGLAAAHYSLGIALRQLGRAAEAAGEFQRARELGLRP